MGGGELTIAKKAAGLNSLESTRDALARVGVLLREVWPAAAPCCWLLDLIPLNQHKRAEVVRGGIAMKEKAVAWPPASCWADPPRRGGYRCNAERPWVGSRTADLQEQGGSRDGRRCSWTGLGVRMNILRVKKNVEKFVQKCCRIFAGLRYGCA